MSGDEGGTMATGHPDEGTIHAWVDGALDDSESSRITVHVAGCADCRAAAADARGVIAGAARVLRALDHDVAGTGPRPALEVVGAGRGRAPDGSLWRSLRVTPARAAIAATVLVVAGLTLTHDWAANERFTPATSVNRAPSSLAAAAAQDPLLDSAVRRNVAQALPPRAVHRAPGVEIPQPDAPAGVASADPSAPARVAEGRAAARVVTQSAPATADAVVASAASSNAAASHAAPPPAPAAMKASTIAGTSSRTTRSTQCLRIDQATRGAAWPGVALPWIVTLDAGGAARVQAANGAVVLDGTWERARDSTTVQLPDGQRLSLGERPAERRGTLTWASSQVQVVARTGDCTARR